MSTKLVRKEPMQFGIGTLSRLMSDCLPDNVKDGHKIDEHDMQELINKLWPALICEHELEQSDIKKFLEENAPVYDDWRNIDNGYCCEITLLKERERLYNLAK